MVKQHPLSTYFANIWRTLTSLYEGLAVTLSWMFRKPVTIQYPFHPQKPTIPIGAPESLSPDYRGFLEVDTNICTGCGLCEKTCPIECIKIDFTKLTVGEDPKPLRVITNFKIDLGKCMYCGLCTEPCPTQAIRHTQHFEAPVDNPQKLLVDFVEDEYFIPYKIKNNNETPQKIKGSIIERLLVERPKLK